MQDPHVLISAYIDHTIDDQGFEQLCDWLRASPANRIAFAKAMSDHAAIAEWAGERSGGALMHELSALDETQFERSEWIKLLSALDSKPGQAELVELVDLTEPFSLKRIFENRSALAWASSALVAAAVLLGVLLVITLSGPSTTPSASPLAERDPAANPAVTPNPTQPVATLTHTHNAQWGLPGAERALARGSQPRTGDTLAAGQRLNLTHGFAEITTNRGAVAIIEAPTTIELINNNALRLHEGKLVGICETPSSKGFVVRTAALDITDLGTRFGVDVSNALTTEVHVFDGEVQVQLHDTPADDQSVRLVAKQSIRSSAGTPVITSIVHDASSFAAMLPTTIQLPGTGQGLSPGDSDPNWSIVAINGQALTEPHALRVNDLEVYIKDFPNDPATSQMIAWESNVTPPVKDSVDYTLRTQINVPAAMNPSDARLAIRYMVDNQLTAVVVNGRRVPVTDGLNIREFKKWHEIVIKEHLVSGINTLDFEVKDIWGKDSKIDLVGLRLGWTLTTIPPARAGGD